VRRTYKFRLFTNANQERELSSCLESHRRLYNACLEQRKTAHEVEGKSVRYAEQSAWYKGQRAVNPYFARLNFSSAQATMRRLDKAFVNFFRRVKEGAGKPGYPRFKSRDRYDSIEFPAYGDGIRLTRNRLRVQHVGKVRAKAHRPVEGQVKTATLKREASKWYVVLSCDLGDVPAPPSTNPPVGIDVGLESFLTTSEGKQEPNPRYLKHELPALRRANRAVSRKQKNGKNRRKAVHRLQTIHARVRNLRREHHHQTALTLILAFGLIALERLHIRGMLRNGRLARAIADAAWGGFVSVLKCKAERAGVSVVEVDPQGTSQECSQCGWEVRKGLSVRWHDCPHCGLSLHRDHNSALVILARARPARTEPAEANVGRQVKRPPRSSRVHAAE
jgi:putative transposase